MSDNKRTKNAMIFVSEGPEPKTEIVTCAYCGTKYDTKDKHEPGPGYCPNCRGTVKTETDFPASAIGRTYDRFMNPYFKPDKVKNKELLK